MYKYKFLLLLFLIVLQFSCSQKTKNAASFAEDVLKAESALRANPSDSLAEVTKKLYLEFVNEYPTDSLAPVFLFKASDVSRGLGNFDQAISLINQLEKSYPKHPLNANASFAKGFIYQNELNQIGKAIESYQYFVDNYPDHPLAPDARILLSTIHLDSDELLNKILHESNEVEK